MDKLVDGFKNRQGNGVMKEEREDKLGEIRIKYRQNIKESDGEWRDGK